LLFTLLVYGQTCNGITAGAAGVCSNNGRCISTNLCYCFPGWTGSVCNSRNQGFIYSTGTSTNGIIGDPTQIQRTSFYRIGSWYGYLSINSISAGSGFTLTLTTSGDIHGFGSNTYGQLGTGAVSATPSLLPIPIKTGHLATKTIVSVAACAFHSLAVDSDGVIYAVRINLFKKSLTLN
jgi:alpha-tubulin suppressor-like RCC1 family protein